MEVLQGKFYRKKNTVILTRDYSTRNRFCLAFNTYILQSKESFLLEFVSLDKDNFYERYSVLRFHL